MNQNEAQALFLKFAAPLAFYVRLGGRKEAIESVARTLWAAMLGGPAVEEQVWNSLRTSEVDSGVIESIRACYYDEMRPQLSDEDLGALRQRYGIEMSERGP
jgi:hypothetical protein